jgi:hypothetical protein
MTSTFTRRIAMVTVLAASATAALTAITRADPPAFLFMDIDNNDAMVVQPPTNQTAARIFKQPTKLSDELADAIVSNGQPVGDSVIVAYQGKLYILPDKKVGSHMASHMVMRTAGAPMRE